MIDLRSDTVTVPSAGMRAAMAAAEVGDDVFGEDPTVRALEERVAALLGMEAGVFVTSGTQANLVAILAHCRRGDEVILGSEAHIFYYELAGCAAVAGVQPHLVPNLPDGSLAPEAVAAAVRPPSPLFPPTTLVCLENTHNRCGGAPLDAAQTGAVAAVARQAGLALHLDGARLFNAAAALGTSVGALAAGTDSACIALSKGLGAPAGSVLCGTSAFITHARRWRKTLGGGLRQVGILAAAGLYALDHMVDRLAEDHANARYLAEGLAAVPGVRLDPAAVRTNIIVADIGGTGLSMDEALERLANGGVQGVSFGPTLLRLVTHDGITRADVEAALTVIRRVFAP